MAPPNGFGGMTANMVMSQAASTLAYQVVATIAEGGVVTASAPRRSTFASPTPGAARPRRLHMKRSTGTIEPEGELVEPGKRG